MTAQPLGFIALRDVRKQQHLVNFAHVQLVSELPDDGGTLIRFADGEELTVAESFDVIAGSLTE